MSRWQHQLGVVLALGGDRRSRAKSRLSVSVGGLGEAVFPGLYDKYLRAPLHHQLPLVAQARYRVVNSRGVFILFISQLRFLTCAGYS